MGSYISPSTKAVELGRRIEGRNYDDLVRAVRPDENIVLHFDMGLFKVSAVVDSPEEYSYHMSNALDAVSYGWYAVPKSVT